MDFCFSVNSKESQDLMDSIARHVGPKYGFKILWSGEAGNPVQHGRIVSDREQLVETHAIQQVQPAENHHLTVGQRIQLLQFAMGDLERYEEFVAAIQDSPRRHPSGR